MMASPVLSWDVGYKSTGIHCNNGPTSLPVIAPPFPHQLLPSMCSLTPPSSFLQIIFQHPPAETKPCLVQFPPRADASHSLQDDNKGATLETGREAEQGHGELHEWHRTTERSPRHSSCQCPSRHFKHSATDTPSSFTLDCNHGNPLFPSAVSQGRTVSANHQITPTFIRAVPPGSIEMHYSAEQQENGMTQWTARHVKDVSRAQRLLHLCRLSTEQQGFTICHEAKTTCQISSSRPESYCDSLKVTVPTQQLVQIDQKTYQQQHSVSMTALSLQPLGNVLSEVCRCSSEKLSLATETERRNRAVTEIDAQEDNVEKETTDQHKTTGGAG
ncbi:unnamed protein product [Pleuronectes platessa]|uniref:Uncharacterized protein n=1 Tax=Pleuronectes platessa TaxID=8262 RepID=A0A9N7YRY8_PLEPL|nr:unnamed protein product [Pleuronectes platessa]